MGQDIQPLHSIQTQGWLVNILFIHVDRHTGIQQLRILLLGSDLTKKSFPNLTHTKQT